MHFPERIKSISPGSRVLEVGPGSSPHPRSDLFLERLYEDEAEHLEQCGMAEPNFDQRKTVYFEGGRFPFDDREFDYVICSHVLEHVPKNELDLFMSELQRIAPRGYIEFPSAFYEMICFPSVHFWFLNHRDDTIILLEKTNFRSNWFHKSMREMWYANDKYLYQGFKLYKEFFFIGFEWEESIRYRTASDWDDLVTEADYDAWRCYFRHTHQICNDSRGESEFLRLRPLIGKAARYFKGRAVLKFLLSDSGWK